MMDFTEPERGDGAFLVDVQAAWRFGRVCVALPAWPVVLLWGNAPTRSRMTPSWGLPQGAGLRAQSRSRRTWLERAAGDVYSARNARR